MIIHLIPYRKLYILKLTEYNKKEHWAQPMFLTQFTARSAVTEHEITHPITLGLSRVGYFRLIREITTAITATINDPKVIISEMASYTVIISNHLPS